MGPKSEALKAHLQVWVTGTQSSNYVQHRSKRDEKHLLPCRLLDGSGLPQQLTERAEEVSPQWHLDVAAMDS